MRTLARLGAYAASATIAVTGTLVAAPSAQAVPLTNPVGVTTGSSWLARQLTDGVVHNRQYDYDDYGLSIDVGLALDAVGGNDATVQAISTKLAANINGYSAPTSATKAGIFALAAGANPSSYGGKNLVSIVSDAIATTSPIQGRLLGNSDEANDFASTITQAYAVHLLSSASDAKAASATSFLLDQQCPNGGFRQGFSARSATEQGCTSAADAGVDSTAIALLQLEELSSPSSDVTTAIANGKAYLTGVQSSDGSWGGGAGTSPSNANSTGLAAWAIGNSAESAKAARWIRVRQASSYDRCDALWPSLGAVSYDSTALFAGRSDGLSVNTEDQYRRATAQALVALSYLPADSTPSAPVLTGPSGYQKAGDSVTLRTTGIQARDQLCLFGPGTRAQGLTTGTSWDSKVKLPSGTATRSYSVRDADGHVGTTSVKVLGAKTLAVKVSPTSVRTGRTVTATVSGLAPNEVASVHLGSTRVDSGRAGADGVFTATFSSGSATGRQTVTGYGRFTDIRRGSATLTVVR